MEREAKVSSTNICRTCLGTLLKKITLCLYKRKLFLCDKSNLLKESFITEINNLISVYGSISYFGKKLNKIAEAISSSNPLEFNVKEMPQKFSELSAEKSQRHKHNVNR